MLPSLQILQPTTVADASAALNEIGDGAKIYAGGAELLLLLRQKLMEVEVLVDIKKIVEVYRVSAEDGGLRVGSCLTHQVLADNPLVHRHAPSFAYAESQVANVRVRNQGTLGGNLCFNDPHSDPGTVLLVHDASVKVANYKGERQIPLEQFFLDMYATALRPNEILIEVQIPKLPDAMRSAYLRLHRYQRPTVGVAAAVRINDGSIAECRLAVGCAGPKPVRLRELEAQLTGAPATEFLKIADEQKEYLRDLLRPVDDLLGSADYKLYMTRIMIKQALEEAARED
ncbi:MAG: xanthine dehydrogenase family protein subunit M [Deltaproteobacteria bacterium]|nr:xanthine dehydrogenase family protein subunit M [Deltaproteobacteria bacterium]